jgi:hypothetical protein
MEVIQTHIRVGGGRVHYFQGFWRFAQVELIFHPEQSKKPQQAEAKSPALALVKTAMSCCAWWSADCVRLTPSNPVTPIAPAICAHPFLSHLEPSTHLVPLIVFRALRDMHLCFHRPQRLLHMIVIAYSAPFRRSFHAQSDAPWPVLLEMGISSESTALKTKC